MKTTLFVAALAAGVTLAATANARQGNDHRMDMPAFEELDMNNDGGVTTDEIETAMQARAQARFAETDTNNDGALSAEEMLAHTDGDRQERMARRIADRIEKADTNGDGLLQADEIQTQAGGRGGRGPERMFNRFDMDENGALSAEEFAEAQSHMAERGHRGQRAQRGDN